MPFFDKRYNRPYPNNRPIAIRDLKTIIDHTLIRSDHSDFFRKKKKRPWSIIWQARVVLLMKNTFNCFLIFKDFLETVSLFFENSNYVSYKGVSYKPY